MVEYFPVLYNLNFYLILIDFYLQKYSAAEVEDLFFKNTFTFDPVTHINNIINMALDFMLIS